MSYRITKTKKLTLTNKVNSFLYFYRHFEINELWVFFLLIQFTEEIHKLRVLTHFNSWDIFGLVGIRTFWAQKSDKKNWQNSFWTISSFLVPNCSNIFQNIYHLQKELKHFGLEILGQVLNCLKYFFNIYFGTKGLKNQIRKTT